MSCLYPAVSCTPTLFTPENFLYLNSCMLSTFEFLRFEMWSSLILSVFIINRPSLFSLVPCICPQILHMRVINWRHGTKAASRQAVLVDIFQKCLIISLVFLLMCMCMYMCVYMQVSMCGGIHTYMWVNMSSYTYGGTHVCEFIWNYMHVEAQGRCWESSQTTLPSYSFEVGYQNQTHKLLIWGRSVLFPENFSGTFSWEMGLLKEPDLFTSKLVPGGLLSLLSKDGSIRRQPYHLALTWVLEMWTLVLCLQG